MVWFLRPIRKHEFSGPGSFSAIQKIVEQQGKSTKLIRIIQPSDVNISATSGATPAGFRFNIAAFQQLCGELSSGLYTLLSDIWTSELPEEVKRQRFMQVYRCALDSLGKSLIGYKLVSDQETGEVVGVVGRKYKFVPNADILSSLSRQFQVGSGHRSVSATLRNRDLLVVGIRNSTPVRSGDVEFQQGLAVFNSETTRQAIFVPQLVFDSRSRTYSMVEQSKANRMIHRARKNFAVFLDDMLSGAIGHESILDKVVDGQRRLSGQQLCDRSNRTAVLARLAKQLREKEIGAKSVELILQGLTAFERATHWHLYQGLLSAATKTAGSDRLLRVTAFQLLVKE